MGIISIGEILEPAGHSESHAGRKLKRSRAARTQHAAGCGYRPTEAGRTKASIGRVVAVAYQDVTETN